MVRWGTRSSHIVMRWPQNNRYIAHWKRIDTWRRISRDHRTAGRTLVAHNGQTRIVLDEMLIAGEVERAKTQHSTEDRRKFCSREAEARTVVLLPQMGMGLPQDASNSDAFSCARPRWRCQSGSLRTKGNPTVPEG
jgi:hypothetical protein